MNLLLALAVSILSLLRVPSGVEGEEEVAPWVGVGVGVGVDPGGAVGGGGVGVGDGDGADTGGV